MHDWTIRFNFFCPCSADSRHGSHCSFILSLFPSPFFRIVVHSSTPYRVWTMSCDIYAQEKIENNQTDDFRKKALFLFFFTKKFFEKIIILSKTLRK